MEQLHRCVGRIGVERHRRAGSERLLRVHRGEARRENKHGKGEGGYPVFRRSFVIRSRTSVTSGCSAASAFFHSSTKSP